jgi:glutamate formiminotransferase
MKFLFPILAAVLLTNCTNTSDDFDQVAGFLRPGRQQPIARSEPLIRANAPRLQVSFLETELAGVTLLEGTRDGIDTWLSADGGTLIMQRGMLQGTRGFG